MKLTGPKAAQLDGVLLVLNDTDVTDGKNPFCMWRLCAVQQFLLIIICFKIPLGGCVEPYKNCRVMSACFRFSIMTSSWSELAWVLRSVRRTMLRRLNFFPLNKTNKHSVTSLENKQSHQQNQPPWQHFNGDSIWNTSFFVLCFCLEEIHGDNKRIHPCRRGVKERIDSHTSSAHKQDVNHELLPKLTRIVCLTVH